MATAHLHVESVHRWRLAGSTRLHLPQHRRPVLKPKPPILFRPEAVRFRVMMEAASVCESERKHPAVHLPLLRITAVHQQPYTPFIH